MAKAPPPKIVAPTLSEEEQRAALDAAHAAAVAGLEAVVDKSIAGKTPDATGLLRITLPLGASDAKGKRTAHAPQVLADLCAHYQAAGWTHATVSSAALVVESGALVQATDADGKPLDPLAHPALYLVAG